MDRIWNCPHASCIEEGDIPQMNIGLYMLDQLKTRIQLARQIDVAQHKANKEKHEKNWLKETADAMEIELDSDFADGCARLCLVCHPVFKLCRL